MHINQTLTTSGRNIVQQTKTEEFVKVFDGSLYSEGFVIHRYIIWHVWGPHMKMGLVTNPSRFNFLLRTSLNLPITI